MNKTVINGQLKQIRGQAKAWQGQLAGNKFGEAAARFDKLIGLLQEKYGYSRGRAEKELQRRIAKHQANRAAR